MPLRLWCQVQKVSRAVTSWLHVAGWDAIPGSANVCNWPRVDLSVELIDRLHPLRSSPKFG